MGLLGWLRGRRKREDEAALQRDEDEGPETPDYPIPEGGIDALRADQQATLTFGVTPEEAARMARREDE